MTIAHHFDLHGILDPFTLLKVNQALREMDCDKELEIIYAGQQIPPELFKVLPSDQYKIIRQEYDHQIGHCQLILRKTALPAPDPQLPSSNCDYPPPSEP